MSTETGYEARRLSRMRPLDLTQADFRGFSAAVVLLGMLSGIGCAPAPIYTSHRPASSPGEDPTAAALEPSKSGLTITAPLDNLTESRIISLFGPRKTRGGPGSANHQGIDIKASPGETVRAAAPGAVTFSGRERGYGNLVILDHGNGVTTYYAHLLEANVRRGERVAAGETIGRAGKDGTATTTHLHFELRSGGTPIDPMPYLMACLRPA